MLESYPPDLRDFVIQKVADGSFRSVDEFAIEAASLYRDLEIRHQNLRIQVEASIEDLDKGSFHDISNPESLDAFFERIKNRGKAKLSESTARR